MALETLRDLSRREEVIRVIDIARTVSSIITPKGIGQLEKIRDELKIIVQKPGITSKTELQSIFFDVLYQSKFYLLQLHIFDLFYDQLQLHEETKPLLREMTDVSLIRSEITKVEKYSVYFKRELDKLSELLEFKKINMGIPEHQYKNIV